MTTNVEIEAKFVARLEELSAAECLCRCLAVHSNGNSLLLLLLLFCQSRIGIGFFPHIISFNIISMIEGASNF